MLYQKNQNNYIKLYEEYKKSKEVEYQIRYIDEPIYYKKEGKFWEIISENEFARNVNDGLLILWENNFEV